MSANPAATTGDSWSADRRELLRWTTMLAAASGVGLSGAHAQSRGGSKPEATASAVRSGSDLRRRTLGFMLAHEQFPVPQLVEIGAHASRSGFQLLATSDHFQPWQANQGHAGEAWVTLGALGAQAPRSWMGTTVTCPTLRYNPAVVAETFATLSNLYPGRIFLGVGSGEALNEQAATGEWPKWPERWERLVEAIDVIRQLWAGQQVRTRANITRWTPSSTIRRRGRSRC